MRAVEMDGGPDSPRSMKNETLIRLKQEIEGRKYRVDAQAVAREIVFKLRMLALLSPRSHRRS
jgi:anti-sigma28 factor (negative regulator of flagellin synthesis)